MSAVNKLLRKSAIEKMSSPEKLDMAMRVTSPISWLALTVLGVMIAAAVVFGIVGRITVKVDASGILLRGETVETIQVTTNGVVETIEVEAGDTLVPGQIVARLDLPDLKSEIHTTEARILDLRSQVSGRQASLATLERSYQNQLNELFRRRKNIEDLVERQLKTRNDLAAIDAQISSVRAQMMQSELGETSRVSQISEQERRLEQLTEQYENSALVRSPYGGRVAAILKTRGQVIRQGERLLNLEDPEAPFQVLLFVPFAEGKKIKPGMMVRISPSTVKPEEYGFILGEIRAISSQPVTPEEVRAALNNDMLAQKFSQDTPFRVRASPLLDETTASGFKWTSSGGPPVIISANTPCNAQIITDKKRPISYIIPTVKKTLGVGA